MVLTDKEKQKVAYFIHECHLAGIDAHAEAMKRFHEVLSLLEINTRPYRLAWSVPTGFYVLHNTQEAIEILKKG